MQVLKKSVKEQIVSEAQKLFMRKGFINTNLREIADKAGCSLSNLYNYFKNKDDLFGAILQPVIQDIEKGFEIEKQLCITSSLDIKATTEEYRYLQLIIEFVYQHREILKLLLFKSEGSKWHNYQNNIIDQYTELSKIYLRRYCKANKDVKPLSDIFIHNVSAFYVNTLIEMLMHDVKLKEMKHCTKEVMRFSSAGWYSVLGT